MLCPYRSTRILASTQEACQRISALSGVERKPTQVARFLKGMGLKWQRVRAILLAGEEDLPRIGCLAAQFGLPPWSPSPSAPDRRRAPPAPVVSG